MAIWDLRIKNRPITLRYQVNLPLAGIMFMPNYGQSYYEIFTLGHWDGVVNFTSLHNQPSLRQMLTADFPVGRARMRFAYIWDAQQSKVNEIKTHTYSHVFMVGFVKELYLFPNKRKVKSDKVINDKMIRIMCMKRRYILIIWSILLTLLPLLNGCIREEEFDNTPQGNFEALWEIIDEQYCFLDYKQIDWDAIHDKYQPLITPGMSYDGLFEILGNMLAELKDGHVNLYSSSNMARYWDWYLDYPRNFNESIIEKYLGRDYRIAGGAKYTILEDNIGYIYYGDFSSGIGNGNLDEILLYLSACNG